MLPPIDDEGHPLTLTLQCWDIFDSESFSVGEDIEEWVNRSEGGVVVASLGVVSGEEMNELVGNLARSLCCSLPSYRLLIEMCPAEQDRLRQAITTAIGAPPFSSSPNHLEYLQGHLRIQASVPDAIFSSRKVKACICRMSNSDLRRMRAIPLIACPTTLEQFEEARRSCEIGIGIQAIEGLYHIESTVMYVIQRGDTPITKRATL